MAEIPPPPVPTQLIVFADDWGRHPSSSQHLIRELLPQYPTLWVNTVGTRKPRLSRADLRRGYQKLWNVMSASDAHVDTLDFSLPENLYVIEPFMYPGFRAGWQRRLNRRKLTKAIHGCFGETLATTPLFTRTKPEQYRRVVITTLPITADLVGSLNVDRWVYYCVDDYSQWPGVDLEVMQSMELELLAKVDTIAAVSDVLADHLKQIAPQATPSLITHGVQLDRWDGSMREAWNEALDPNDPLDDPFYWYEPPAWVEPWDGEKVALFWGLLDERLDVSWLRGLRSRGAVDRIALVGPTNAPPPGLGDLADLPGKVEHGRLAALAQRASVLIMPYIDAPVTRAMQPLKLLEYLATMKPVVVRDLPSTRAWADCCDLASTAEEFVQRVEARVKTGTPPEQVEARKRRLASESWTAKAAQLAAIINADDRSGSG